MSNEAGNGGSKSPLPETRDGKLPYEKPTLRSEGVFETMALACSKQSASQATCKGSTKLS